MAGGNEQDPLAVAALGEIDTTGALSVRCGLGSNGEPEGRSKRTTNVDLWV